VSALKSLTRLAGPTQLSLVQGGFGALGNLLSIADRVVTAHNERLYVRQVIEAIQVDQVVRHADVQVIETILDKYSESMSPQVRDEYHLTMLRLLDVRSSLPTALLRAK
jgi:polyphosphate kinase